MIRVYESKEPNFGNLPKLLDDQGYNIDGLIETVIDNIADRQDKFPNIHYGLNGDVADDHAFNTVKEYVIDFIVDNVVDNSTVEKDSEEYDIIDIILHIVDDNIDEFYDLDSSLDGYEERQAKIWKDDEDDLNRWWYRTRL